MRLRAKIYAAAFCAIASARWFFNYCDAQPEKQLREQALSEAFSAQKTRHRQARLTFIRGQRQLRAAQ